MQLFTIGFTGKRAEAFFAMLGAAGVRRVIDVRLNNNSQLAGFSKRDDLEFFLREISDIGYSHVLDLAPTRHMLDAYRKGELDWPGYEAAFIELITARRIEGILEPQELQRACLLCSEHQPHRCHRRLVAEYLERRWENISIEHLV